MKKQKKQSLLTALIIILVIILVMMIGSIAYEEVINMNKQPVQKTDSKIEKEETIKDKTQVEEEKENEEIIEEPVQEEKENEEYIGEEEKNTQENNAENKDEKAINLVKKEWGNDDSVTFSIVDKKGTIYRVSVRSSEAENLQWYEVDTETWEVSEY